MIEYADDRPWPGSSGWSDAASRSALQAIAGAVEHLAGYEISCINVVHRGVLRAVAVHGTTEQRAVLMDSQIPVPAMEEELAAGVSLGRFVFVAAGAYDRGLEYGAVFDVDTIGGPDGPADDAYHVEDLLVAPLRDDEGRMVAMVSVDVPVSRRRADPAAVERLDRYAELVDTAVRMALDHDQQRERIRMARAARQVVAAASRGLAMQVIFDESAPALMSGFAAQGVWFQTFDGENASFTASDSRTGVVHKVPDEMLPLAESVACREWAKQRVTVLTPDRRPDVDPARRDRERDVTRVLDYLAGIGVGSVLLVPVGVGSECLGCLALSRPVGGRRWTAVEIEAARDIGMDLGRAVLNARAYEREERAVHELQALDAYKSQLVATLSHELKTPLASILGNLELLEGEGLTEEDGRRGLSAMGRGAARLVRVVDDLMLLAKIGDPSYELITRPVDLDDVVVDVLDLLGPTAHQRGVELELVGPTEPVVTLGDAAELDRVVTNIIANALKYTPPGGRVEIRVGREGDQVVVTCADTGIGISEDDQGQLFREFFRSTDPAAQAQAGTGLGLTIVDRIVRRHQGRVEVESVVGAGSTFRVVLPEARDAGPTSHASAQARAVARG